MLDKNELLTGSRKAIRNYISLQEATKFCNYSQEYLALRARQGKLKAAKLGRNWVTTKDWLQEYLAKGEDGYISLQEATKFCDYSQEYLSLRARQGKLKAEKIGRNWVTTKERLQEYLVSTKDSNEENIKPEPPANLPIGQIPPPKLPVWERFRGELNFNNLRTAFALVLVLILLAVTGFLFFEGEGLKIAIGIFGEYGEWVSRPFAAANNFLSSLSKKLFQMAKAPLRGKGIFLTKEELLEIEQQETKKIIEEIQKLKEEGITVKEITKEIQKITEVKPVTEITKETVKIDEKALKELKKKMAYLEEELGKRLYAPGGVITQQIYITEPVMSPKIYQENGEIVLQTLGSGNVIISAATGLQLYGKQVVIESTSLLNPLIYLASPTRIGGDLTVTGSISGGALSVSSIGASGNATIGGSLTVSGDITVSGTQNYSGAVTITTSSTNPALKVTQNGTGNIVQFLDGGTNIFTIADGGYATLATVPTSNNPAFLFQSSDVSTSWLTGTTTFFGINATSGFAGNFLDFQREGTSLFRIGYDGSVISNATITAAAFVSGENDSTVRKSGEEVFREIIPISRYDMPAQTGTTTYFRISKNFDQNPLSSTPTQLPGSTRVYKLIIKYNDDIPTNSSSSWRIYRPTAATTSDTFVLLGRNSSSLSEGIATTTSNLTIPNTDWQVDVRLSEADSAKTLRIFQIFLAAYDRIN